MKKNPTVAVAGAGIAGITAAYFEALKGRQVFLIEPADRAGGLLRSDCTPFGCFDYGTHVGTFTGLEVLDEFLFGGMQEQHFSFFDPGLSGNYHAGTLSEISPFVDVRSLGATLCQRAEKELLSLDGCPPCDNLEQLILARYGQTLYQEIFLGLVKKLLGCDASLLSCDAINLFDMNRIIAFDPETSARLKLDTRYDGSLGYHYAHPGSRKMYPRSGGMGSWVAFLMAKLDSVGVTFLPNCTIDELASRHGTVSALTVNGSRLEVEKLVWSVPPGLFARLVSHPGKSLPPRFRRTVLYDFAFSKPLNSKCYYINVHDSSLLSARVTLYENLVAESEQHTCTVELLCEDEFDVGGAGDTILEELVGMGLVDRDNPCIYRKMRLLSHGFPVPELASSLQASVLSTALAEDFCNVNFVGRSAQRFFMKDVLAHAYQSAAADGS